MNNSFLNLNHMDLIGKVILIYGPRLSGKTELCKYLLSMIKNNYEDPIFLAVNGNYKAIRTYENIINEQYVHFKYSKELILRYVKSLQNQINDPKILLLEDCLWNDGWTKDTSMQYLFRQGKSAQFTTIICTHHPLKIPQSLLQSIDYYFAAADPTTLRTLTGLYGTKDYSEIRLAVGDNVREFEFIVLQKNRINTFFIHKTKDLETKIIQRTIKRFIAQKRAKESIKLLQNQPNKETVSTKEIKDSNLRLRSFDPHTHDLLSKIIIIYGNEGSGKTEIAKYLAETIIKKSSNKHELQVHSPKYSEFEYLNPVSTSEMFSQSCIKNAKNSVIVLDDVLKGVTWMRNRILRNIFMNKKQKNVTLIITLEHKINLVPLLKGNVDYVFISRTDKFKNHYNEYGHFSDTSSDQSGFATFEIVFKAITKSYNFMTLKMESNSLRDVMWFNSNRQRSIESFIENEEIKKEESDFMDILPQSTHSTTCEDHVPSTIEQA